MIATFGITGFAAASACANTGETATNARIITIHAHEERLLTAPPDSIV
jgi:hypothetical protein